MSPHGQDPLRHAPNRRHGTIQSPGADATVPSNNVSIPSRQPRMPPHGQRIRRGIHKPPSHTTAGRKQHRVDRALRATQSRQRQTQTATNHPRLKIIVGRKESKPDREQTRGCCVLELAWTSSKTRLLDLDDVSKISLLFPRESDDCLGVRKIVSFYY